MKSYYNLQIVLAIYYSYVTDVPAIDPFLPPLKILSSVVKFSIFNYFASNILSFAADYHCSSFMSLHFHRSLFLNAQVCDWTTLASVEYLYCFF